MPNRPLRVKPSIILLILLCDFAAVLTSSAQDQSGSMRVAIQGSATRGSQLSGSDTSFVPQPKPIIDVRDTPGVDCTAATDSSAALNSLFTNISNAHVVIPVGCNLSIARQLVIFGQSSFVIDGQSRDPSAGNGGRIYGCGGAVGPLLYINRSGHGVITGLSIEAKGPGNCNARSLFTESIRVDNVLPGGVTTTRLLFEYNWITPSSGGFGIPNYIGVNINRGENMEDMQFINNSINCQISKGSYGILINGGNSDNDVVEANNIHSCYRGIELGGGHATIARNKLGNNGIFGIFGANGADIYLGACTRPILIEANGSSSSGPFLYDAPSCFKGIMLLNNDIGIGGSECGGCTPMSNTAFALEIGAAGTPLIMAGNTIATFGATTLPCVGSNSQGNDGQGYPFGPLGSLVDLGGNNCDSAVGLFQSDQTGNSYSTYQGGEWHPGIQTLDQVLSSPIASVRAGNPGSRSLVFRGHFLNERNVNTNDDWKWQNLLSSGKTPMSTLTLTHTGSEATATVSIPVQLVSTVRTGTAPFFTASTTVVPNLNSSYVNGFSITQLIDTPGAVTVNAGTCMDRSVTLSSIKTTATIAVSPAYALEANLVVSPAMAEAGVGARYRICNVQSSGHIVLSAASTFAIKVIQ